jgi:microcystin-dependent protein
MTGPFLSSTGVVGTPSIAFNSAQKTGFYLAGANQIGWAANGVQGATLNSDASTTWAGAAAFGGKVSGTMGTIPIGAISDFAGSATPTGWLLCYGQAVSRATYAALFTIIGTTYGVGDGTTTFNLPDCRGRVGFGKDDMGGSAANRITVAGKNFDGTVLGGVQDRQSVTLLTSYLPPYTPVGSIANGAITTGSLGGTAGTTQGNSGQSTVVNAAAISIAQAGSTFTGTAQGGTSTPFGILPNAIIFNKIIYAGV